MRLAILSIFRFVSFSKNLFVIFTLLFTLSISFASSNISISDEIGGNTDSSRLQVDLLQDDWKNEVIDQHASSSFYIADLISNVLARATTSDLIYVDVNISLNNLTSLSDLNNLGEVNGTQGQIGSATATSMQDFSPKPASLLTNTFWTEQAGSNSSRNGVVLTFASGTNAAGVWLGDLETRTIGGGTAGEVRIYDMNGNLLQSKVIEPGNSYSGNQLLCGAPINDTFTGCGNKTTRYIGFTSDVLVKSFVIIVGDDDTASGTDNGNSEHFSFTGITIGLYADPQVNATTTEATSTATTTNDTTSTTTVATTTATNTEATTTATSTETNSTTTEATTTATTTEATSTATSSEATSTATTTETSSTSTATSTNANSTSTNATSTSTSSENTSTSTDIGTTTEATTTATTTDASSTSTEATSTASSTDTSTTTYATTTSTSSESVSTTTATSTDTSTTTSTTSSNTATSTSTSTATSSTQNSVTQSASSGGGGVSGGASIYILNNLPKSNSSTTNYLNSNLPTPPTGYEYCLPHDVDPECIDAQVILNELKAKGLVKGTSTKRRILEKTGLVMNLNVVLSVILLLSIFVINNRFRKI